MNPELEQHRPASIEQPSETSEQQPTTDGIVNGGEASLLPTHGITSTPSLPDIPTASGFDLELAITSVVGVDPTEEEKKLHKRASSVLKLTEENEKLRAELKAMTDRLEAAERRKAELRRKRAEELRAREQLEQQKTEEESTP